VFVVIFAPEAKVRTSLEEVRVTEVPFVSAPGVAPFAQNPADQVSVQPPESVAVPKEHPPQEIRLTLLEHVLLAVEKVQADDG
jgi:hypothetical protein